MDAGESITYNMFPPEEYLVLAFYEIIKEYDKLTGCPVIVNTSFNVRGEPIVCSPKDAYVCFMRTEMDVLCMGNFMLLKEEQEALKDDGDWKERYQLD